MIVTLMAGIATSQVPNPTPCRFVEAVVLAEPDDGYAMARGWHDADGSFAVYSRDRACHEADPGTPVPAVAAIGRRARKCLAHWECPLVIVGGMPPRDFSLAVASVMPEAPGRPPTLDEAWVAGLGSGSYVTRRAAHDCLVRAGARAIPALVGGLGSPDAEVRLRSQLILDAIRCGPRPDGADR